MNNPGKASLPVIKRLPKYYRYLRTVAAAAVFVLLMKMDIEALPYSYVVGWILMLVYEAPMMVKYLRKGEL